MNQPKKNPPRKTKTQTIVIANQKGGVGKTTTAINFAHGLALQDFSVLAIDLDPQGQIATAFGCQPEPGVFNWLGAGRPVSEWIRKPRPESGADLHIIPGDQTTGHAQILINARQDPINYLAQQLQPLTRNGLAYIVIDTSPSVGGLQERALFAADLVIVPTACDFLSADSVARTFATMAKNQDHGWTGSAWILPTFFDHVTRESRLTLNDLFVTYPGQVLEPIQRATVLRECAAEGITIWEKEPRGRPAQQYADAIYKALGI